MPDVAADSQKADGNRYCNGHGRGSDGARAPETRATAEKTAPASHVAGRGRMAWIAEAGGRLSVPPSVTRPVADLLDLRPDICHFTAEFAECCALYSSDRTEPALTSFKV
jgi:hypothetical protein